MDAGDAGCIFDGAHGWHNGIRVIELAHSLGMPFTDHDEVIIEAYRNGVESVRLGTGRDAETVDVSGAIIDQGNMLDTATEWLNDHIAPDGYAFEFDDGFMLSKIMLSEIDDEDEDDETPDLHSDPDGPDETYQWKIDPLRFDSFGPDCKGSGTYTGTVAQPAVVVCGRCQKSVRVDDAGYVLIHTTRKDL
jgi:hypothetical protein